MKALVDNSNRRFGRRTVVNGLICLLRHTYKPPDTYDGSLEGQRMLFLRYFYEEDGEVMLEPYLLMIAGPQIGHPEWMIWTEIDSVIPLHRITIEEVEQAIPPEDFPDSIMDEVKRARPDWPVGGTIEAVPTTSEDTSADDLFA